MSWNHRVVKRGIIEFGEHIEWHELRAVYYYAKDGGEGYENIRGWSTVASTPGGESSEELMTGMVMMRAALNKPVLDLDHLQNRVNHKPSRWIVTVKTIRDFGHLESGWDGNHGAPPLSHSIEEAISFCKKSAFEIVHMEPTLHANGSVILEIGTDGSLGSLSFTGDRKIVYACGGNLGSVDWDGLTVPQEVIEALEHVAGKDRGRGTESPPEVEPAEKEEAS